MAAATDTDRVLSIARDPRPGPAVFPSELAQEIVGQLVRQRQELRRSGASKAMLEANRLAIVYWQQRLARAFVAERRPERSRGEGPFGL
jgi:hypothetical protein